VQAAPMARLQQKKAGGSHHRYEPDNRPSLRDSWNGCSELSPGTGVLAPVALRNVLARLGISTGMPGPHGLTVRTGMFVRVNEPRCNPMRPPHPAPDVRDDREAPLMRGRTTEG